ncbi:CLUMA_CG007832, isoform A [Clunio marinus]|uniref:CLUMA_CG007832, isoform A n=1 Tax=Clunio marinus TaxID=568069 RepID=A0A1J1I200_9DIPT|nr:CLUMA_CG007832, isoform A [Clunio marinus]
MFLIDTHFFSIGNPSSHKALVRFLERHLLTLIALRSGSKSSFNTNHFFFLYLCKEKLLFWDHSYDLQKEIFNLGKIYSTSEGSFIRKIRKDEGYGKSPTPFHIKQRNFSSPWNFICSLWEDSQYAFDNFSRFVPFRFTSRSHKIATYISIQHVKIT